MESDALTEMVFQPETYANFVKRLSRKRREVYASDEGCGVLSANVDELFKGLLKLTILEYLENKESIKEYKIGKRGKKYDREIKELEKLEEKALMSYAVVLVALADEGKGVSYVDAVLTGRRALPKDMLGNDENPVAFDLAKKYCLITEEKGFYKLK